MWVKWVSVDGWIWCGYVVGSCTILDLWVGGWVGKERTEIKQTIERKEGRKEQKNEIGNVS